MTCPVGSLRDLAVLEVIDDGVGQVVAASIGIPGCAAFVAMRFRSGQQHFTSSIPRHAVVRAKCCALHAVSLGVLPIDFRGDANGSLAVGDVLPGSSAGDQLAATLEGLKNERATKSGAKSARRFPAAPQPLV